MPAGNFQIPDKKEVAFQFHYKIAKLVEEYQTVLLIISNSEKIPSKYVTVGRTTMTPESTEHVSPAGSTDKPAITLLQSFSAEKCCLSKQFMVGKQRSCYQKSNILKDIASA